MSKVMGIVSMVIGKKSSIVLWSIIFVCLLLGAGAVTLGLSFNNSPTHLIINEVMASNGTGLTDEDGDTPDWIELYNPTGQSINLSGWALTDDSDQPEKWRFPDITLGSEEYLLIFASGKNRHEPLHTNFKLSRTGDFLGLYNILDRQFVDTLSPTPQFRDIAYGRYGNEPTFGYLANPTPGQPNDASQVWVGVVAPIRFSADRGFYKAPFLVELTTATSDATIRYTLDGSQPGESNGAVYSGTIPISGTTTLRAAAFKPDHLPAYIDTYTYLFGADILTQPANPPGFPASWGKHAEEFKQFKAGSPVIADYEMDSEITQNPHYQNLLEEGLVSLPALSIVLDIDDFTDLYSNPLDRGQDWERPASVEFIAPGHPAQGFQVNAGLRIHGGVGRKQFIPKHSLRLLFKGQYGPTRLKYPIFPNSPVEEFNTLVLRGGSDRSFAGTGPIRENTTYTKDEWMRQSQLEMSGLAVHGIFAHVYINGLYWGIYNITERPDTSFMSSYLGANQTDWFVVNQDGPIERESTPWREQLNDIFVTIGFKGRADDAFERSEAELAQQYAQIKPYIDTAQFSDYIILNWYAGAEDWPQNNWYAAIPYPDGKGKFLVWDGQETFYDGAQLTLGEISGARLNIVKAIFEILIQNPDFKMEFADRLYRHLFNGGALTDERAQSRWNEINNQLDPAIVAESARWGDVWFDAPITREDWLKARDNVLAQMEGNAARLVGLAREAGYYPLIDPPEFNWPAGGSTLKISASGGTIYYTTDGSDPRATGTGQISPKAMVYNTPLILTDTTHLKARLLDLINGEPVWSALNEAAFYVANSDAQIRITEIMYNPSGGSDYEFIELQNIGNADANIAGLSFRGIDFTFPAATPPLNAGQYVVLVNNPAAFAEQHPGVTIGGVYNRRLANEGEELALRDAEGNVVTIVAYDDENGWPLSPDGRGDSLVFVNLNGNPNDPQNWRASAKINGSPGAADPQQIVDPIIP